MVQGPACSHCDKQAYTEEAACAHRGLPPHHRPICAAGSGPGILQGAAKAVREGIDAGIDSLKDFGRMLVGDEVRSPIPAPPPERDVHVRLG